MTLGPIDDPIEAVVTETLTQAVRRQAEKIDRLLAIIRELAPYPDDKLAEHIRRELGDKGL